MPASALPELAGEFEWVLLQAGEILIRRGDPGDCLYVIFSGVLQVIDPAPGLPERVQTELGPGEVVGEIALWTREPRSATVRAGSAVRAARLGRAQFDRIAAAHPEAAQAVDRIVTRRLRQNRLSSALRGSKLFGELDEAALLELETELELLWIEGGKTLFRQGEPGDALYLIVSGKLAVWVQPPGRERYLAAELGRGATVGEMSAIDGEPRSATVVAARDSQVGRLSKAAFERLAAGRLAVFAIVARQLISRLRDRSGEVDSRAPSAISVTVAGLFSGAPVEQFSRRLAAAFAALGGSVRIDAASLDAWAGKAGAAQTGESEAGHGRMLELLNQIEAGNRFVVYQADATISAWTSRCLRHCDHVLLLCDGAAEPGDDAGVLRALRDHPGPTVNPILLYRDSSRMPAGTRSRLARMDPARNRLGQHYHIRLDRDEDFARLARSLSGAAFGLVLGGGGARGLAHAGVIRALQEAGVPVDLVGGTSMGSYLAAAIGLGYDSKRTLEILVDSLGAVPKDKTIPIVSLLSGERTARVLLSHTGLRDIEDLWIPFFCVSANLTRARVEVHREGPLAKSLLASSRVPGIFPPIVSDGDLLVDGGIINNVPVDVMRAWAPCGYVIASDVSAEVDMGGIPDYGLAVSGWRALRNWLKPRSKRQALPSVLTVLLRTVEFGGTAYEAHHLELADLYLRPPVSGFSVIDHRRGGEMAEVAYRYSRDKIAEWLARRATADPAEVRPPAL